jgi:hypothetical protein
VVAAAVLATTIALQSSPASAHHPDVAAENVCLDGVPTIVVTATAWETDLEPARRVNTDVRIDVDGPGTDLSQGGVFVSPDFRAQVAFEVPGAVGHTLHVRATAVAAWGPNQEFGFAGTWAETTVTVADLCPDGTFGNEERPPLSEQAPVTTVPAPVEAGPPTTVTVLGATVTRVPAQVPVPGPRQLAFTGAEEPAELALAGFWLVAAGTLALALVAATRARRVTETPNW